MFESAKGFVYEEEAVTNTGEVVTVKKYSKPNVTAIILWLKNRKRNEWRDKQEIEQEITQRTIEIKVGEWDDDD